MLVNKGFKRKRDLDQKLPPGQYRTFDFPVLSLGPTPPIDLQTWSFSIDGSVAKPQTWNWEAFDALPRISIERDIHCVTKWSKFDTHWEGVSLDTLMDLVGVDDSAAHLIAHSFDGYSTNVPLEDVRGGKALIATRYEGDLLDPEHGGPARLLIPHLYFWKSAKWVNRISFVDQDEPGFWEVRGYHNYGDPWKEQRYHSDP